MRFGKPYGESVQDQLQVESIRVPRALQQQMRRFAQAHGLSVSESYRRIVQAGLDATESRPPAGAAEG